MSRHLITLLADTDRERATTDITRAPSGTRVEFYEPKRSIPQNSRLWLLLAEVAKLEWYGQCYSQEEWKDYFMHAYRGEKWMPFEDGGMIPIGRSTSKLSKTDHGELMTLIEAFCARHAVPLPWDDQTRWSE